MSTNKKIVPLAGIGHNRPSKTAAERQKSLYERRKAAGWKKGWIDPATAQLAEDLGGIEHIVEHRDQLADLISQQIAALDELAAELEREKSRGWLDRLLSRRP